MNYILAANLKFEVHFADHELSPAVRAEAYDVSHFPELKDQYGAMSVPCIVITHADGTQQVEFGKKSIPQMLELVGA